MTRKYIRCAAAGLVWAAIMLVVFVVPNASDPAYWFALALSFGGMTFAVYHYSIFVEKVRSGEITIEDLLPGFTSMMK